MQHPKNFGTHEIHIDELIEKNKDVDPFLIRKWERIFTLSFDRNASHEIDPADFYIVLRKIREIYGAESKQVGYARKTLDALWEGLQRLADSDGDELVTIEEWIGVLKKVDGKKKDVPKWFSDFKQFMFKLFNVSEDGHLDINEYADGMSVYGHELKEAHEAFHKFAVDKKGQPKSHLTYDEWKELFYDLFFSADKKALGNHLFGILDVEHM